MTSTKEKKPEVDIEKELQATSFGSQRTQSVTTYTPGKLINLTVDQVVTYDKNPRREDNPEHEQIKSSIRHRGMDQVLSVTQRPDDPVDIFMIIHGGNTRLEILKELYEETKDPKFGSLQCKYVAWESESDAIIGHLIENDARGDYSFIDRAIGVRNAQVELENETGVKLSSRTLLTKLKEQGYKLSRPDLFRMNFAVDILYPAMPKAMDSGIGPRQIDAIKKLRKHTKEMFEDQQGVSETSEQEWSEKFNNMLTQQNNENWSYDELYSDVLLELADHNATEANRLSFILSGRLEGLDKSTTETVRNNSSDEPDLPTEAKSNTNELRPTNNLDDVQNTDNDSENVAINAPIEPTEPSAQPSTNNDTSEDIQTQENQLANDSDFATAEATTHTQIEVTSAKDLRSKLFTCALKLASNNGFGELITPLPSYGAGFIVKDLPPESYIKGEQLFGTVKKRPYKERIMVWWMLFGFSEQRIMALNNPEIIQPLLPESELKNILFGNDESSDNRRLALAHIFQRTGEFIIDDLSIYFWAVASEQNIAHIQEIQKLYRQLNEVLDFNLWEKK